MKEYSELELNKMMATLEFDDKNIEYPIYGKGRPYVRYYKGDILHSFNAITNKEFIFDLMVKYKVEINYHAECCSIYDNLNMVAYTVNIEKSEIPRAIIECILKSENIS